MSADLFDGSNAAPEDEAAPERLEVADRFLDGSTFTRVSLRDVVVADSLLIGARIEDADAEGMTFVNVNLCRATFRDVNLSGATIAKADLSGVAVTDATLDGTTIDGILVSDLLAKWRAP